MFIKYNANPFGANIDDCIIRAIAKATGKPYLEIFDVLCQIADNHDDWDLDDMRTMTAYLRSINWELYELVCKVTVKQFAEAIREPHIVIVNGHATFTENGNVYDTWNPNRYKVKYVFRKCIPE